MIHRGNDHHSSHDLYPIKVSHLWQEQNQTLIKGIKWCYPGHDTIVALFGLLPKHQKHQNRRNIDRPDETTIALHGWQNN